MINMYVVHFRPVCASGTSSGVDLEDEMLLESLYLPSRQCRPFRPINLVGRRRKGGFTLFLPIHSGHLQVSGAPNRRVMNFTRHLILLFVILLLASHQKPIIDKEMEVN